MSNYSCQGNCPTVTWFPHLPVWGEETSYILQQGYRSCISKVFLAKGIDIPHYLDLNMLVKILPLSAPFQHREAPKWDLMIVLMRLMRPPFEPMNWLIWQEISFLLTLASAKRNSEVWAFSAVVRFGLKRWTRVSQRPLCTCHDPLHPSVGEDLPDRFFVPRQKGHRDIISN